MPQLALAFSHQYMDKNLARVPTLNQDRQCGICFPAVQHHTMSWVFLKAQGVVHEQAAACALAQDLLQGPCLRLQQAAAGHRLKKPGC